MLTFLTTLAFSSIPLAAIDLTGGDNGLTVQGGLQVSFGLSPLAGYGFYWFVLGPAAAPRGAPDQPRQVPVPEIAVRGVHVNEIAGFMEDLP